MIILFPDSVPGANEPRAATIKTALARVYYAAKRNAGTARSAAWVEIGGVARQIATIAPHSERGPRPDDNLRSIVGRQLRFTVTTMCGCKADLRTFEEVHMAPPLADDIITLVPLTQYHCDNGIANECNFCPAALALTDGTDDKWLIYSDNGEELYADENSIEEYAFTLSDDLQERIRNFDTESEVMVPGTLVLDREDKHIDFAPNP